MTWINLFLAGCLLPPAAQANFRFKPPQAASEVARLPQIPRATIIPAAGVPQTAFPAEATPVAAPALPDLDQAEAAASRIAASGNEAYLAAAMESAFDGSENRGGPGGGEPPAPPSPSAGLPSKAQFKAMVATLLDYRSLTIEEGALLSNLMRLAARDKHVSFLAQLALLASKEEIPSPEDLDAPRWGAGRIRMLAEELLRGLELNNITVDLASHGAVARTVHRRDLEVAYDAREALRTLARHRLVPVAANGRRFMAAELLAAADRFPLP